MTLLSDAPPPGRGCPLSLFRIPTAEIAPGYIGAVSARANLERRAGSPPALACAAFEAALASPSPPPGEPLGEHLELLFLHYARFAAHGLGDAAAARSIYERAVAAVPARTAVWEAWLAFELSADGSLRAERLARARAVIERACRAPEGSEEVRPDWTAAASRRNLPAAPHVNSHDSGKRRALALFLS